MQATVPRHTIGSATVVAYPQAGQRRHEQRWAYRTPCEVRVTDQQTGEWRTLTGQAINISVSGMALRVAEAIPVGARVEAIVPRAVGEALWLVGKVVHNRRVLTGVFEIGVRLGLIGSAAD